MVLCDVNNTAHWIGLHEVNDERNLIQYLGVYLIFIAAALVFSTVSYYQVRKRYFDQKEVKHCEKNCTTFLFYRLSQGESSARPKVLFDGVTREDADKSVVLLVKYLFNYGFYKFGIEVTLVALAILICVRRDTLSIVYIIWLCMILSVQRSMKEFIWPILQNFVTIAIILQYAIMLNLPSFLELSK